jgi:hypothetical protein
MSKEKKGNSDNISLSRINGILSSRGPVCVVGMLIVGEDDHYYLEDTTMRVKIDLTFAESDGTSHFSEGNVVLCEGVW